MVAPTPGSRRHRCPRHGVTVRSTPVGLLHCQDMECAHIVSSFDSPLAILQSRKHLDPLPTARGSPKAGFSASARFSGPWDVIGRPELSHVSTEGGRVGIWTRHLLTNNKPQLLNDRDAQRSFGMSEIAR